MTTPIIKESPSPLSAMINHVPIDIMINHASRLRNIFREKTTPAHISPGLKHFYPRNIGLNTIITPTLNLYNPSPLRFFPLSPIHLAFSHSLFSKLVLAPQPHYSASEEAPGCICAYKPLQHLFKPYPKPTLHLHLHLHLHLCNPYYAIKSMFDTLTNPMLHHLHKPTFRHHHNKLHRRLTSINILR